MALQTANGSPPSNSLSLSEVNTELGKSSTTQIALNDADVRGLIGKGVNETFGMIELYGASSVVGWIRVMPFDITNHSSTTTSVVFDSSDNMYALILNTQKSRSGSWNNTALPQVRAAQRCPKLPRVAQHCPELDVVAQHCPELPSVAQHCRELAI